jgi:8-oxo-dGTP pyrophosphatase MutT (NUDIX family)
MVPLSQVTDKLGDNFTFNHIPNVLNQAAVLFPIGPNDNRGDDTDELCLILNKRSKKVRQAGDLCFPGGSVSRGLDRFLGTLMNFPLSSLRQWKYWPRYREKSPEDARKLAVLYAASLRESFEEMRLNPFGVKFLGTLPPKQLVIRNRFIFPMVGWIPRQKKFFPNWEVDEIVPIPFNDLLNPENYAICQLGFTGHVGAPPGILPARHPGYFHKSKDGAQLLWGATYRIAMDFLNLIFGFIPPDEAFLPVVKWELDENYFNSFPT